MTGHQQPAVSIMSSQLRGFRLPKFNLHVWGCLAIPTGFVHTAWTQEADLPAMLGRFVTPGCQFRTKLEP